MTTGFLYLLISVPLIIWVGITLSRSGRVFLIDVFDGDEDFADAVNRLLLVGFYLVNVGFVLLSVSIGGDASTGRDLLQQLSVRIGILMLVLGLVHLLNVRMLSRFRRRRRAEEAGLPLTGTKEPTPSGY